MYEAGVELHNGHEDHLASMQSPSQLCHFFAAARIGYAMAAVGYDCVI